MAKKRIEITMTPCHPGEFIRTEVIEELGLSATRAAQILDVGRATLSALLNGKVSLSSEMGLRVEKAFNIDMLLKMQAWHDATLMRTRSEKFNVQTYIA